MGTDVERAALAAELGHELSRHARLLHVMRSQLAAWAPEGLDWSAFALLMSLVKFGPRRQGELAEAAMLDPSTVSRHVAQLVRFGLVERRPDPADGRAVQIAACARGNELAEDMIGRRQELVRRALAGWELDDVATLVRLFARLNDDLDAYRPQLARTGPRTSIDPERHRERDPEHDPERTPTPGPGARLDAAADARVRSAARPGTDQEQ